MFIASCLLAVERSFLDIPTHNQLHITTFIFTINVVSPGNHVCAFPAAG